MRLKQPIHRIFIQLILITSSALIIASLSTKKEIAVAAPSPAPPDTVKLSPLSYRAVQERLQEDLDSNRPVVIHVIVALCDNENQGIIPVPKKLGNGQEPSTNLYWGAAYGVRAYMTGKGKWKRVRTDTLADQGILERVVLKKTIKRSGKDVTAYLVAEAWDGSKIKEAMQRFATMATGRNSVSIQRDDSDSSSTIQAGGDAHLIAYVGHNGLMEFRLDNYPVADTTRPARSALALACASKPYLLKVLQFGGSHPLLLTTNLMAPEAYSLDAAISGFVGGKDIGVIHADVAKVYNAYQKCGMKGARNLFSVEE
ncbi:MAG: hypothetical protein AB7H80_16120 [Candidatus Kapaibacterium sp.]